MRLVEDARHFWKWFSVQAMALAAAVQGAWAAFSDDLKQNVPHWLVTALTLGLLFAGIVGRLVRQKNGGEK
jgi:ABC-type dipeptide/oligopeptide/nickel transport system permease component